MNAEMSRRFSGDIVLPALLELVPGLYGPTVTSCVLHHTFSCLVSAEYLPLPPLNYLEQENLNSMKQELASSIKKGVDFVASRT